ncbi:MAG TPA: hypothetical protein VIF09_13900 [Polyangiaceae bacterium]
MIFAACGSGSGDSSYGPTPGADGGGDAGDDGSLPGFDDGGGEGGFNTIAGLFFDPPTATLTLDGTKTGTASFTLKARYNDGSTAPVQATSLQFDRPDLAAMTAGEPVVLTAGGPYGGVGTLHAIYGGQNATAQLVVQMQIVVVGPGVDPGAVTALGGASLPQDPSVSSLLYPYDKTVFALGLASPLVMWNAPNAADVYRLHYEEQNYTYDGYYTVAQPAQLRADQASWDHLTASNGGDPLKLALSRWDAGTQKAYASASQQWTIVPASLRGAIYYWTTSGTGHMSRIHPGTGATPEILNNGTCMGCHAVSADGSTLVAAVEGEGSTDSSDQRAWVSYDLPNMTIRKEPHLFGGNVAVTPDGKTTVFGTQPLHLADTTSGTEIPNSGIETFPLDTGFPTLAHPVFSPDGKHFAAVESNNVWHEWTVGKLVLFDYDATAQKFTGPTKLADGSAFTGGEQAVAYPSFSPDSAWLAFHAGDYAGGCHDACNATTVDTGSLWLQATSGAAPVRMTTLTDSSPNPADHDLSFEPTFNPIERGGYFWVVFTSMRDWGNRVTGTPNCGKKRLWVAAIDKSGTTADPSHPAFFLEGQEEATMNMRGFWALAACIPTQGGGSCQQGFDCCSGFCDKGVCVDTGTLSCKGVGDTCVTSADCCNSSVVSCVGGKCQTQNQ